jgi:hypothetical protein
MKHMDVFGHKDKMLRNNMFVNSSKFQHNKAYFPLLSTRRNYVFFHHPNSLGFQWNQTKIE